MIHANKLLEIIHIQRDIARLGLDLSGVMSLITERLLYLLQADGSAIELNEAGYMVYRAAAGVALPHLGMKLAVDESLSGWCLTSGLPQICHDTNSDPRVNQAACQAIGIQSMALMPLKHFDTVVGVLKVMAKTPQHFSQEHVAILALMCEQIAAAMYFSSRFGHDNLWHAATHDQMTQLANRALFMEKLRAQLYVNFTTTAILIIDMNGLKQLNDLYGHRHGDAVLAELASRLKHTVRPDDMVARLGGDEFGILLTNAPTQQHCHQLSERIRSRLIPPFHFDEQIHHISVSIGAAMYPDDASSIEALLDAADHQMYANKRQWHEQTHVFAPR